MATDGQPVVPTQGQPVVLRSTDESHTGIVCENMQGLAQSCESCLGKRKYARRLEVMRVVSRHVGHV